MSRPPIGPPSDIANSLQYLDDTDLHRLQAAVGAEIDRRKQGSSTGKASKAPAPPASRPVSWPVDAAKITEIPEGKTNLVRASLDAGLNPSDHRSNIWYFDRRREPDHPLDEEMKPAIDRLWRGVIQRAAAISALLRGSPRRPVSAGGQQYDRDALDATLQRPGRQ